MAIAIVERKVGETGNPLIGTLDNGDNSLVLNVGDTVTLSATRTDTSQRVIDAVAVTVLDIASRLVRYDWRDADLASVCTLDAEFTIKRASDQKPTYVPDKRANRFLIVVGGRIAA